jgi:serine/threonine-protein kinase
MDKKTVIRIGLVVSGGLFGLAVLASLMVNTLMDEIVHTENEVIVPDIIGKTLDEALTALAERNLSLMKVAEKYDTEVPAGSVISQSPPPGLTVREGKPVEAVISSGGQVVFVPVIEGKSLRQVELLLRQASLAMGEQTRTYSSTVKRDHVISQEPGPGQIVEKNSYVNVVVSRGALEEGRVKTMVNVLGRSARQAERELRELDLEITDISTTINDELEEGTVIFQDPPQGTIVDESTRIKLIISTLSRTQKEVRDETVYYEVTQTGKEKEIKIVLKDDIGERIVHEGVYEGGTKIEVPVKILGQAEIEFYADGIMVREETLE